MARAIVERSNERLEEKVRERTRHLRESEQRYRTLFETIDEGFCILQVHFDAEDRAVDYRFVELNPAFERQTGLVNAQGKTAREMVPDLEERWYQIYGRVAKTGKTERFVESSPAMGLWFEVDAFRVGDPSEAKVALLFRDITERKRSEEELLRVLDFLEGITRGSEDLIRRIGLMRGKSLSDEPRGDADLKTLPLLALTGYGQPEDRQRSRDAGFDAHLTNPVDLFALDKALRRLDSDQEIIGPRS